MKTREEVEALKDSWLKDSCWTLAETEGFEEYAVELAGFEAEHTAAWQAARENREAEAYRNTPASEATLRDTFAAHALEGELANSTEGYWTDESMPKLAERCYLAADAMMKARREKV